jgi:serine/threonine-protein kinase RsbW
MGDRLHIEVPSCLVYRDSVGALILQICERLEREGLEPGTAFQVVSAFNEAFNNVALHSANGAVQVLVELSETELCIEMRDYGPPFDYSSVPMPDLDDLPESGLGVFIMRSFMTRVDYTPRTERTPNVLRMVRALTEG